MFIFESPVSASAFSFDFETHSWELLLEHQSSNLPQGAIGIFAHNPERVSARENAQVPLGQFIPLYSEVHQIHQQDKAYVALLKIAAYSMDLRKLNWTSRGLQQ